MKKQLFIFLTVALLAGCNKPVTLVVTNSSMVDRKTEMVEIAFSELQTDPTHASEYALYDEQGKQVPFQLLYNGQTELQTLLFQLDEIAWQRKFTWRKGSYMVQQRVSAQYVAERKDDFAWENDLAAYRMYGPALADENPSNGVDLWLKSTEKPIVAKFYDDDLHHSRPYHINYGEGLDCYKVAHTLGCGGVAPYKDGQLLVGDHYLTWEILEEGPIRVVFCLTYPTHILTVTCDAGAQLNKAEVRLTESTDSTAVGFPVWAAGIYLHDTMDNVSYSQEKGWAAYAENAVSDGGEPEGRNYCAVYMPDAKEIKIEDGHLLVIGDMPENGVLTYWFGGGWSQWKYPTDADWFTATSQTVNNLSDALEVSVAE